jgi:uncharacterized membrane protein
MLKVIGLAALAGLCWGTASIIDRVYMKATHQLVGVFVRGCVFVVACLILIAALPAMRKAVGETQLPTIGLICASGILAALGLASYLLAMKLGNVAVVIPVTHPVLIATATVLSLAFLKEPLRWTQLGGIALLVAGICLLSCSRQ